LTGGRYLAESKLSRGVRYFKVPHESSNDSPRSEARHNYAEESGGSRTLHRVVQPGFLHRYRSDRIAGPNVIASRRKQIALAESIRARARCGCRQQPVRVPSSLKTL
jgi:hypothetical protein